MLSGPKRTIARARRLRREMSPPEIILWRELRKRPGGWRFRRQHPAGPFVADFFCHKARLVIEIDGSSHDMVDRPAKDVRRDRWFSDRKLKVVRIPAQRIFFDLDAVVIQIVEAANSSPSRGGGPRSDGEV
ncbi:endonuclease domain-containing protein [Parasphingopyxis algicola]|uniref:endonuclease domain-containing protein n=1 Tax=Parasphingopyxis algicola TaxID=2026624 RepID=UPI0015A2C4F2|nr:DUF559 domain-containing protein [Parasphingopyxis algicola]QLC24254.1 endonuclease domain-containing protein [Parasphingopyxis algicola]